MSVATLKLLLERSHEIRVKGFPEALEGSSGQKVRGQLEVERRIPPGS